jgi:hypothetical protein
MTDLGSGDWDLVAPEIAICKPYEPRCCLESSSWQIVFFKKGSWPIVEHETETKTVLGQSSGFQKEHVTSLNFYGG